MALLQVLKVGAKHDGVEGVQRNRLPRGSYVVQVGQFTCYQ